VGRLLDMVRSAETLPVFPIGGPDRRPVSDAGDGPLDTAQRTLRHADSWDSAFVMAGIDDITMCAAMAGPVPEGAYAREYYRVHPVTDPELLHIPDPHGDEHLAPSLGVLSSVANNGRPVLACLWGPLTVAATLMGVDDFLRTSLRDPRLLESMLSATTDAASRYARAALNTGADFLWIAEPLAAMFGTRLFEDSGLPHLRAVVDVATSQHTDCVLHVCGDTTHLTEALADTGAAGLSVDAAVDLVDTAERCGDEVVVMGNLWPMDLLAKTPAELRQATSEMVTRMQGRPYIAATGCSCPPGTPAENLASFVDTARGHAGLGARNGRTA